MGILLSFFYRDWAVEKSYRFNFFLKACTVIFQLAVFYFICKQLNGAFFSYIFIGLVFTRLMGFWLNTFTETIRQEQYWGTAELLFLSPRHPLVVVLASGAGKLYFLLLEIAFYLIAGHFLFGAQFTIGPRFLLPLLLSMLTFVGMGLLSASCILYFKRGDPVNWIAGGTFELLSGVYFPLAVLPGWLQKLSWLLPTTPALALWRAALEGKPSSLSLLFLQAGWGALLCCMGIFAFFKAYDRTRAAGELGSY